MSSQEQQLRNLKRTARLRTQRNWALGLGFSALLLAVIFGNVIGVADLSSYPSAFAAIAGEGFLRWSVVPLMAAGFALIMVGALLHGLSAWKHGEV
jgi:hypothetical protein